MQLLLKLTEFRQATFRRRPLHNLRGSFMSLQLEVHSRFLKVVNVLQESHTKILHDGSVLSTFKNSFMHIASQGFLGCSNICLQTALFQTSFESRFWTVW